ncbi:MAG: TerC/Alx family metal homeostasis membrane protein [Myxococcales bacterium]
MGLWGWILFAVPVLAMLVLDLRAASGGGGKDPTLRSAALWTSAWIGLALVFGLAVYLLHGGEAAVAYLTAYVVEESLSIDNIFVFVLIFSELRTPAAQQRKVLYWGIVGAVFLRAILIASGMYLLDRFQWITYVFAAVIVLAAARIVFAKEQERRAVVKACAVCDSWVARFVPITPVLHDGRFIVRQGGRWVATPLLIALVVVETTDFVFALDSIPAAFAISRVPFLVYTSNVFAMLGLRSLYFVLGGAVQRLRYLRAGLAIILAFVGAKMLLAEVVPIPTWVSLAVIAAALGGAVIASVAVERRPSLARP